MSAGTNGALRRNPKDHFRLTPAMPPIPGDRSAPRLPIAPHLRAVVDQSGSPALGCPIYSRIDGRYPRFEGYVLVDEALAALVAGEA